MAVARIPSQRRRSLGLKSPRSFALLGLLLLGTAALPMQAQERPVDDTNTARSLSRAFRRVSERAIPTVVKISTHTAARVERRRGTGGGGAGGGENPFKGTPFEEMFRDDPGGMFREFRSLPQEGLGSGVIIDASGVVLTNRHVVEGADEVTVLLHDGREIKAKDIRTDQATDLAVIRLEGAANLPYAKFGNSDQLEIGDWVVAVGNPFDQEATVTAGIISAKGRSLGTVGRTQLLQTDAAINPGNSGGPLLDLDGNVVGINTAIASSTGGYQGIGFAIPSNTAKWVASQLIDTGTVRRAYLGVSIEDMTLDVAQRYGVRRNQGVLVTEVHPDTPAAKAGVRVDDVILEFGEQKITSRPHLQGIVERQAPGTKHAVVVLRDGKQQALMLTLEAFPEQIQKISRTRPADDPQDDVKTTPRNLDKLGFAVTELSTDLARRLGYDGLQGVLVADVDVNSNAYRRGIRNGMLILAVEKQPVATVDDVEKALANVDFSRGVLLRVRAGKVTTLIVVN